MNDKAMQIAMIVDRSGSMSDIAGATVEGLNTFLEEQKKTDIDVSIRIVQFDNEFDEVYVGAIAGVPRFTLSASPGANEFRFEPRNSTALNDAIGRTINEVGKKLGETAEDQRPSKVVIVIMTDGMENASTDFKRGDIATMIKHQQEVYNWQFQYLGANQDAVKVAGTMNIKAMNAITFNASQRGTRSVLRSAARNTRSYGVTGQSTSMNYGDVERCEAMAGDNDLDALSKTAANLAGSTATK